MPSLSPTMTQGVISAWKKKEGESLSPGEILCEIETDKASVGFEIQDEGVLAKILYPANGPELNCGEPIALIAEDEASYKIYLQAPQDYAHLLTSAAKPAPVSKESTSVATPTSSSSVTSPSSPTAVEEIVRVGPASLSPAARHIVESKNLSGGLNKVVGTGKKGHITKGDVIEAIASGKLVPDVSKGGNQKTVSTQVSSTELASAAKVESNKSSSVSGLQVPKAVASNFTLDTSIPVNNKFEDIPNTNMRKVIGKRLMESKTQTPHFYTSMEVEIDEVLSLRKYLKSKYEVNVSVNDLVIKSAACALRDFPQANSKWNNKTNQLDTEGNHHVDISVAVATPTGLITPIVKAADKIGVKDINEKVKDLANRAKENKLKLEEFVGGSFSISNLGMFNVNSFSAVINPPQACILAVGSGIPKVLPPLPGSNVPRVATVVTVQLSGDRRVVNEAQAAQFLQILKTYLKDPKQLMM